MYVSKLVKVGKIYARLANNLMDTDDHITILLHTQLISLSKQILSIKESSTNSGTVSPNVLNKIQSSLIRLNGLALEASISSKDYQSIIEAGHLLSKESK